MRPGFWAYGGVLGLGIVGRTGSSACRPVFLGRLVEPKKCKDHFFCQPLRLPLRVSPVRRGRAYAHLVSTSGHLSALGLPRSDLRGTRTDPAQTFVALASM